MLDQVHNSFNPPTLASSNTPPLLSLLALLLLRSGTLLVREWKVRRPLIRACPLTPTYRITSEHRSPDTETEQESTCDHSARKCKVPCIRQLPVKVEGGQEMVYCCYERGWVGVGILG